MTDQPIVVVFGGVPFDICERLGVAMRHAGLDPMFVPFDPRREYENKDDLDIAAARIMREQYGFGMDSTNPRRYTLRNQIKKDLVQEYFAPLGDMKAVAAVIYPERRGDAGQRWSWATRRFPGSTRKITEYEVRPDGVLHWLSGCDFGDLSPNTTVG